MYRHNNSGRNINSSSNISGSMHLLGDVTLQVAIIALQERVHVVEKPRRHSDYARLSQIRQSVYWPCS